MVRGVSRISTVFWSCYYCFHSLWCRSNNRKLIFGDICGWHHSSWATGVQMEQTIDAVKTEFTVNDMGERNWLRQIPRTFINTALTSFYRRSTDTMLNSIFMQYWKPVSAPIDSIHKLKAIYDKETKTDATACQQIFQCLMYLVTGTWPDLVYTLTHLSHFISSSAIRHHTGVNQVSRYLQQWKIGILSMNEVMKSKWQRMQSNPRVIVSIRDTPFWDIFFILAMLPSPGDVENRGLLPLVPLMLHLWHLVW